MNTTITEQIDKFGDSKELLLEEFKEAWSHYRHLELSRSRYLGFFFTITIASLGLIVTFFKDFQTQEGPWLYFGILSLLWVVNVLSLFIFCSIKKIGFVLRHYESVMEKVRGLTYENSNAISQHLWVRNKSHPVMTMRFFSAQGTSEAIPAGFITILTIVQAVSIYMGMSTEFITKWQGISLLICFIAILICELYIFGRLLFHKEPKK